MFKTLAFMMQNNAFLRVSADTKTCGSPLSATSVAIVIIPNSAGMFNANRTFLIKKYHLDAGGEGLGRMDFPCCFCNS
jgi:hypothetical protein